MRKIYTLLGCLCLFQVSNNASAQVIFSEDFSTATGTTPPTGWTNNEILAGGGEWDFDNSGGRTGNLPLDAPFAIFDSDYLATFGEETALESPIFDATAFTGSIFLSFDHFFNDGAGGEYYVEVYNGTTWVSILEGVDQTPNSEHVELDLTPHVTGVTDAQVRFRWVGEYSFWWIVDNVIVKNYSCAAAANLDVFNETFDSFDISWAPNASAASWTIEWGVPGFIPGTGDEIGSDIVTTPSYSIPGLTAATDYEIYFQTDCGGGELSPWKSIKGRTLCSILPLPWYENFDTMTTFDYDLFPDCWRSEQGEWMTDDSGWSDFPAYSGSNFAGIQWSTNDYLWTPSFELTAGRKYEFSFMYMGDGNDEWSGEAVVNSSQISAGATVMGVPFLTSTDVTTEEYQKVVYCFTPTQSGTYSFGVHVSATSWPYFLAFDDFSVLERGTTAGTNASVDVCQSNGLVDLNTMVNSDDAYGTWQFDANPNAIENDTLLNPESIPAGTFELSYVTTGCLEDTATAIITISGPSNAGIDGNVTVCKNEPMNLLEGLTGTVDLGGDWYNSQNQLLTTSQIMSPNFPGQYNYKYITGNNVCPDDTSGVLVTVGTCDWLSVDEMALEEVNLYPNPSTGVVFIESNFSTGTFNLEVSDVNGRIVETGNNSIAAGTNTVNLSKVQKGTYFFKLSNENAEKVYRVVIQ
ncbi:hypothetical protein D3C87_26690 [compost metagenome]